MMKHKIDKVKTPYKFGKKLVVGNFIEKNLYIENFSSGYFYTKLINSGFADIYSILYFFIVFLQIIAIIFY